MADDLRRRELLKRALAGALGAQLAAWTAACSPEEQRAERALDGPPDEALAGRGETTAEPARDAPASVALLRSAWARARAQARPLFVLVIPEDRSLRAEHGWAWGELLLHGSEAALSRLAACELSCATLADVRTVFSGVAGMPARECAALLLTPEEAQGGGARALAVEADVRLEREPPCEEDPAAAERPFRERLARLEAALRRLPDGPAGDPRRVQGEPPPGAAWATNRGCATVVEGHPELGPLFSCGMGHVPVGSQRFLHYLVAGERLR